MKTCGTCKFWETGPHIPNVGAGNCTKIPELQFYDNIPAYVDGYDSHKLSLVTRPSFGCILHEDKPSED